jgi:hypothetical protein
LDGYIAGMKIVGNLLGIRFTDYFSKFEHEGNWITFNKASFLHADGKLVACKSGGLK